MDAELRRADLELRREDADLELRRADLEVRRALADSDLELRRAKADLELRRADLQLRRMEVQVEPAANVTRRPWKYSEYVSHESARERLSAPGPPGGRIDSDDSAREPQAQAAATASAAASEEVRHRDKDALIAMLKREREALVSSHELAAELAARSAKEVLFRTALRSTSVAPVDILYSCIGEYVSLRAGHDIDPSSTTYSVIQRRYEPEHLSK